MKLPAVKITAVCTHCGADNWALAVDKTEYTNYTYEDGQWVDGHSDAQDADADDSVRFICQNCGTRHAVPEGL